MLQGRGCSAQQLEDCGAGEPIVVGARVSDPSGAVSITGLPPSSDRTALVELSASDAGTRRCTSRTPSEVLGSDHAWHARAPARAEMVLGVTPLLRPGPDVYPTIRTTSGAADCDGDGAGLDEAEQPAARSPHAASAAIGSPRPDMRKVLHRLLREHRRSRRAALIDRTNARPGWVAAILRPIPPALVTTNRGYRLETVHPRARCSVSARQRRMAASL